MMLERFLLALFGEIIFKDLFALVRADFTPGLGGTTEVTLFMPTQVIRDH